MTTEELVNANEALATLLKESLTELEKIKAERDAAAASAQALADKLAHRTRDSGKGDRVYVSVMSESDLDDLWWDLAEDQSVHYWDNGEGRDDPENRWQLEIWCWNAKTHVIAHAPTKEILQEWEPALLDAWRRGMYSLWRYMTSRVWGA